MFYAEKGMVSRRTYERAATYFFAFLALAGRVRRGALLGASDEPVGITDVAVRSVLRIELV